jgi:hypothetical protein
MTFNRWALTVCAAAMLSACGGGDDNPSLNVQFTGLENLGASSVYEGWLIVNGAPKSAGRFTVDDQGVMSQSSFVLPRADLDAATAYVLTIEPQNDTDAGPTATHLLAGDFDAARTRASLSIGHAAAVGHDFTAATGQFFLATPTNSGTDEQGIWWIDASTGTMRAGLNLPTLPAGWTYEGWVVVDGQATSTGRFASGNGADSDGAGPAKGLGPAPAFPGQDFVNPPKRLPGGMAVISVEPQPDNSTAPFLLKPLLTNPIAAGTGPTQPQVMLNQALRTNPTGTVTVVR